MTRCVVRTTKCYIAFYMTSPKRVIVVLNFSSSSDVNFFGRWDSEALSFIKARLISRIFMCELSVTGRDDRYFDSVLFFVPLLDRRATAIR